MGSPRRDPPQAVQAATAAPAGSCVDAFARPAPSPPNLAPVERGFERAPAERPRRKWPMGTGFKKGGPPVR